MKRKLLALFLVVAMLGVSLFAGLTTVGAENGAKASTKINTFDDMENYKDGEVVASYDYKVDPVPAIDTAWRVASTVAGEAVSLTASTARAYSGKTSMMASTANGRYFGFRMNAVQQKAYTVSFYAYVEGEEGETPLTVNEAYVYPTFLFNGKSQVDFFKQNADGTGKPVLSGSLNGVLAWIVKPVDAANKWQRVELTFVPMLGDGSIPVSEHLYLWFSFTGNEGAKLYIDDIAVYEALRTEYSAGFGGNVTSNLVSDSARPGEEVVFTAEPFEGNTFVNWTDVNGNVVSTEKELKFIAEKDVAYIANFNGPNKPTLDVLALRGFDGSFESYDVDEKLSGWDDFSEKGRPDWFKAAVSDFQTDTFLETYKAKAANGEKALGVMSRGRDARFPLTGLVPNTNYKLSFNVYLPEASAQLDNFVITADRSVYTVANVSSYLVAARKFESASGWNTIEMVFNSGLATSANFLFKYISKDVGGEGGTLYFDDFHLYAINGTEAVVNGDFEKGAEGWYGDTNVVADGGKNVLKLDADKTAYTDLLANKGSSYEVTFKAKGKGTAAAIDFANAEVAAKNYISSVSAVEVDSADWKEYTFKFYAASTNGFRLAFEGATNGLLVDDVAVRETNQISGAIVEKIDFESDRFELKNSDSAFSLVKEDGNTVLKYTLDNETHLLDETFLSYQAPIDATLRVSFRYKISGGKQGGAVYFAPEYTGQYGSAEGFEHTAADDKWQTAVYYITNTTHAAFKIKLAANKGTALSDFYIDDISISLTPPMVLLEDTRITYCEELYNAIDNPNFEKAVTDKDWANLPSTAKIVKGDALKGSHFLRATAGTHIVVPVAVQAGTVYTLGASIRGEANTVGYVGLAINDEGNDFYVNRDDIPASRIEFNKEDKGWNRSGFKVTTDTSGIVYLVIHVESGTLDVDSLMLFTDAYMYRYDPNDYTVYVPYDYDNLKSSTTVINGGFGDQPYYKPTKDK